MSVNQHKAPPGALPWLFVTVDERDYAFPLSNVLEVSRPAYGPGEIPSSVVLRGREMRLVNLPAALGSVATASRILRLRTPAGDQVAVAVPAVPGTRWRLQKTLFPAEIENLASFDAEAQQALGLLRIVGPEHPPAHSPMEAQPPLPVQHGHPAQESGQ